MKKSHKSKIFIIVLAIIFIMFFSNDFMLIEVQKIAIVTGVGIDVSDSGEFEATLQIAVPESSNSASENQKAVVTGKGKTVAEAILEVGDITGWYPKLNFCNLVLLGKSVMQMNVIEVIDYFSKTLKVQDSALVAVTEKPAKDILNGATPLDNISSFALQKILVKDSGMTIDVDTVSIKDFAINYYSRSSSCTLPFVTMKKEEGEASKPTSNMQNGSNSQNKGNEVYNASTTLLFKNGLLKGSIDEQGTKTLNILKRKVKESVITVNDVDIDGQKTDVLLTVLNNKHKSKLKIEKGLPKLYITVNIFTKTEDENGTNKNLHLENNIFVNENVLKKAEEDFKMQLEKLIERARETDVDLLGVDNMLFKYHHKYYNALKDNLYGNLSYELNVNFLSQK